MNSPVDLILHIGTGKAGSKSIQNFLRENRKRLGELDLLYPETPGSGRHRLLGHFTKSREELAESPSWVRSRPADPAWYRDTRSDPATFRREFRRRLLSEVESSGLSRVLLSDEILFGSLEPGLGRLRRLTDRMAKSVRLVVYLRRQDDHVVSRYQQGVKTGRVGGHLRLRDWVAQPDRSRLYDYYVRLHTIRRLIEPSEFVVRRFEPEAFIGRSLYQDFLEASAIDVRAEDLQLVSNRNESLDADSVEFLRLINLYRAENQNVGTAVPENRAFIGRLAGASTGPVLTLSAEFLDRFMAQWEDSNRLVAVDFLGDQSGQLFRVPRRTQDTTTDQRLDPTRINHFLQVSELPERIHEPLRRLAEREATAP